MYLEQNLAEEMPVDLFAKELTDLQNKYGLLITEVKDGRMTIVEQATNNKILVEMICEEIYKLANQKKRGGEKCA